MCHENEKTASFLLCTSSFALGLHDQLVTVNQSCLVRSQSFRGIVQRIKSRERSTQQRRRLRILDKSLQLTWYGQNLLDLLSANKLVGDCGTLDRQRSLCKKSSIPLLLEGPISNILGS